MRNIIFISLLLIYQISTAHKIDVGDGAIDTLPNDTFWINLQQLCGKTFKGKVEFAPEGDTVFTDQELLIYVSRCEGNKIYIHLHVGEDRSRTWVLTRADGRILLKHDHRHMDGTEDRLSQYGGWTTSTGMSYVQIFPADQFTADILPAAATNVWWIELISDQYFTYNLRRLNTDRFFSLRFDLNKTIDTPPNAWGWDE